MNKNLIIISLLLTIAILTGVLFAKNTQLAASKTALEEQTLNSEKWLNHSRDITKSTEFISLINNTNISQIYITDISSGIWKVQKTDDWLPADKNGTTTAKYVVWTRSGWVWEFVIDSKDNIHQAMRITAATAIREGEGENDVGIPIMNQSVIL